MFSSKTKQLSGGKLHKIDGAQLVCQQGFFLFFGTMKETENYTRWEKTTHLKILQMCCCRILQMCS